MTSRGKFWGAHWGGQAKLGGAVARLETPLAPPLILNSLDIRTKTVTMKLKKRAAMRNIPSQVRHCVVTPKVIINFWQK